jgi:hypothetical protein
LSHLGPQVLAYLACGTVGTALAPALETRAEQRRRLPSPVGDGRYEFERLIGEGRHKRVYLAIDRHAGREVGLALIKAQAFDDLGEARVWREFEAIARISGHTNTVAFYDSGEDSYGRPYLVTEHAGGGDVSDRIAEAQRRPIALEEVLGIATSSPRTCGSRRVVTSSSATSGCRWPAASASPAPASRSRARRRTSRPSRPSGHQPTSARICTRWGRYSTNCCARSRRSSPPTTARP